MLVGCPTKILIHGKKAVESRASPSDGFCVPRQSAKTQGCSAASHLLGMTTCLKAGAAEAHSPDMAKTGRPLVLASFLHAIGKIADRALGRAGRVRNELHGP